MNLLAVERIKLFSTKSAYWSLASVLAASLLFALMIGLISVNGQQIASTSTSQSGMGLGMMVFIVLATLSMTTEYRFSTIRATFLATPNRTSVFVAKTVVLIVLGAGIALISSFASFFLIKILAKNPASPLVIETSDDWRMVLGNAALFAIAGVISVSVGALIRQSAGAISLLLVWAALIEGLVTIIPRYGPKISPWLPFNAGGAFTTDRETLETMSSIGGGGGPDMSELFGATWPTPVQGLLVFAGTGVVLWLLALITINRRDA